MVRRLGSSLTDLTYVFDEPTIGLHPHDGQRMNELLLRLRDKGNTVLVVEHEPEVIAIADHVVDMGPGAGQHGGTVVYEGGVVGLRTSDTLTGRHLDQHQAVKATSRTPSGYLRIERANLHNLRDVTVDIPTGVLTAVTGVAGSGKSSLIHGCLPSAHADATFFDQSAIRGSRRSNPATYTGILEPIRRAFARENAVKAALFSANSEGACPECKGIGLIYTDLAFMAGVASVCEGCEGKRFTDEVLTYRLRGQEHQRRAGPVRRRGARVLHRAGRPPDAGGPGRRRAGLHLPRPAAQHAVRRRTPAAQARDRDASTEVYVLDEPTGGLHMNDVDNLINLLDRLVDRGRTVIVIEHNLDIVARRLGHRPRPGSRPRRRPGDLRGHAGRAGRRRALAHRSPPEGAGALSRLTEADTPAAQAAHMQPQAGCGCQRRRRASP